MQLAYQEAINCLQFDEVPVGAVIVFQNQIISHAGNRIYQWKDPTAHAEILAIREAARILGSERLTQCDLFTTLEPCTMCTGALLLARLRKVYFLTEEFRVSAFRRILEFEEHNHYPQWEKLIFPEFNAKKLLQDYFLQKRNKLTPFLG